MKTRKPLRLFVSLFLSVLLALLALPAHVDAAGLLAPKSFSSECVDYQTIRLSWDEGFGMDGYELRLDLGNEKFQVLTRTTQRSYLHTGVQTGAGYSYRLYVYKTVLGVRIYSLTYTVAFCSTILTPPTGVTARSVDFQTIRVAWAAAPGASWYEVERASSSSGPWTTLSSKVEATSYTDSTCVTGSTYYYLVYSIRDAGWTDFYPRSIFSEKVSAVPTLNTPSFTGLAIVDATTLHPSWTAVAGASGYELQYATSASGPWTTTVALTNSADVTGLKTGVVYSFKVRAFRQVLRNVLYGGWSAYISGMPLPPTPTGLKVTVVDFQTLGIEWKAVAGAKNYLIDRSVSSSGPWTTIYDGWAKTYYEDRGLRTGMTFYYRICARQAIGLQTFYSLYCTPVPGTPVLGATTGLAAVPSDKDGLSLSWRSVAGADGYQLQRCTTKNAVWSVLSSYLATTGYLDRGLDPGVKYVYRVRAYRLILKSTVYGSWSSELTASPSGVLTPTPTVIHGPTPTVTAGPSPTAMPTGTTSSTPSPAPKNTPTPDPDASPTVAPSSSTTDAPSPTSEPGASGSPSAEPTAEITEPGVPGTNGSTAFPWLVLVFGVVGAGCLGAGATWVVVRKRR